MNGPKISVDFDVVVVGAGPGGCQAARSLSYLGHSVLLVERVSDFQHNNFSSAGSDLLTLEEFSLPESVVGSFFSDIKITSSNRVLTIPAKKKRGLVFDFLKLRTFLAKDAQDHGASVLMGHRYISKVVSNDFITLTLESADKKTKEVRTKVVVDATGPAQAVLYDEPQDKPESIYATGMEYIIKVTGKESEAIGPDTLQFYFGNRWCPYGYGWVFPMGDDKFKVGACAFTTLTDLPKTLKEYTDSIISDDLKLESYKLIETHGSTCIFTEDKKQRIYSGRVLGVGDTIYTLNPIAGEGVRHSLFSGAIAAKHVDSFLKGETQDFSLYEKEMKRYLKKWPLALKISKFIYYRLSLSDKWSDFVIGTLGKLLFHGILAPFS